LGPPGCRSNQGEDTFCFWGWGREEGGERGPATCSSIQSSTHQHCLLELHKGLEVVLWDQQQVFSVACTGYQPLTKVSSKGSSIHLASSQPLYKAGMVTDTFKVTYCRIKGSSPKVATTEARNVTCMSAGLRMSQQRLQQQQLASACVGPGSRKVMSQQRVTAVQVQQQQWWAPSTIMITMGLWAAVHTSCHQLTPCWRQQLAVPLRGRPGCHTRQMTAPPSSCTSSCQQPHHGMACCSLRVWLVLWLASSSR